MFSGENPWHEGPPITTSTSESADILDPERLAIFAARDEITETSAHVRPSSPNAACGDARVLSPPDFDHMRYEHREALRLI